MFHRLVGCLLVLAVLVITGCGGGPGRYATPTANYTSAPRGTRTLEEEMRRLVLAEPDIQNVITGRSEGTDYWIVTVPYRFPIFGEDGGTVKLLFNTSVSFSGEILQATDPCRRFEYAYRYENLDPCQKERREFTTSNAEFRTRAIEVWVDVLSDRTFNINSLTADPAIVDEMIDAIRSGRYE